MGMVCCPICGSEECEIGSPTKSNEAEKIHCIQLNVDFYLGVEINYLKDPVIRYRLLNIVTEKLIRQKLYQTKKDKKLWFFVYEENEAPDKIDIPHRINLANEIKLYPKTISGRVERALLNLGVLYPNVGKEIHRSKNDVLFHRELFCESAAPDDEVILILRSLRELNYIDVDLIGPLFVILYEGWKKIEELTKRSNEINQGFIAMSYAPEAKYIMEAFREAIELKKYKAQIISEKEHNHQIIPEMFYEIERSKFMVVDVTYQNYGAYYEAGYAQALGKEVIVCCNEGVFKDPNKKPHFDISQKPIIIWKDVADLKQRLIRRIEATVH